MTDNRDRNSWIIRDYRFGDEKQINALFNAVFQTERPLENWFWKFDENPLKPEKYMCLAERDSKILAMYPCLPSCFRYFQTRCVVLQAVDNCVHNDLRKGLKRQGIFLKVLHGLVEQAIRKGCAFGFGFPTDEHFRYGEKKLGYLSVGQLPVLQKNLSGHKSGGMVIKRIFSGIRNNMTRKGDGRFIVREVRRFGKEFDRLWAGTASLFKIAMERDAKFLNWRYIDNPAGSYKCLAVYASGDEIPCGYIVGRVRDGDAGMGLIFDFVLNGPEQAGAALLEYLADYFLRRGVRVMECRMFEHVPMYPILVAFGFQPIPHAIKVTSFLFDKVKIDREALARKENWYLTLGDSDTD